jgi:hypothetical protein
MPTVRGGRPVGWGDSLCSEMRSIRWAGALIATIVLCAALALAPADAKKKRRGVPKVKTTVTLTQTTGARLSGTISSKLAQCRQQRLVSVYFTDLIENFTQPVSVQRSNNQSKFIVDLPQPVYGGNYQAIVVAQIVRAQGKKQKCKEGRSAPINVPPVNFAHHD